jgi:hypothetical protein
MKNLTALALTGLVAAAGLLTASTSPAAASPTTSSSAASGQITCVEWPGALTVKRRAPVHTAPSGKSGVAWFAAQGKGYRIGGYCDNSAGNRWYCVAGCDFSDAPTGFWIWEDYFRA